MFYTSKFNDIYFVAEVKRHTKPTTQNSYEEASDSQYIPKTKNSFRNLIFD